MSCGACDEEIFYNHELKQWYLKVETSEWDHYNDGFYEVHIPINYCPECGKHLNLSKWLMS